MLPNAERSGRYSSKLLAYPLETERPEAPDPDVTLVRGGEEVRLSQRKGRDRPLVISERTDLCMSEGGPGDVPHLLACTVTSRKHRVSRRGGWHIATLCRRV